MAAARAYTNRQFVIAVCLAAVLGWATVALPFLWLVAHLGATFFYFVMALVIGLPIAFVTCWAIVAPILWFMMVDPIGWLRAAFWGATIPAAMAIVVIVVRRLEVADFRWREGVAPSLVFVIVCLVIALIVRAVVGPGKRGLGTGAKQPETTAAA